MLADGAQAGADHAPAVASLPSLGQRGNLIELQQQLVVGGGARRLVVHGGGVEEGAERVHERLDLECGRRRSACVQVGGPGVDARGWRTHTLLFRGTRPRGRRAARCGRPSTGTRPKRSTRSTGAAAPTETRARPRRQGRRRRSSRRSHRRSRRRGSARPWRRRPLPPGASRARTSRTLRASPRARPRRRRAAAARRPRPRPCSDWTPGARASRERSGCCAPSSAPASPQPAWPPPRALPPASTRDASAGRAQLRPASKPRERGG
mmetsp:Transcript_26836/g.78488  ORF Transcript_26836/g.78488 Transcript_26836/m.78488 type:complete len:265 (+) Transcript_26836:253-1047(+)